MALVNLSICCTWKIIEPAYNNKLEISVPTWNDEFDLPDDSYSITQMQYCFEYFIKNIKMWQIIHPYRLVCIKSKIELFLR